MFRNTQSENISECEIEIDVTSSSIDGCRGCRETCCCT